MYFRKSSYHLFLFCRDALKRNYNLGQYFLEVNVEDLGSFDEMLADKIYKQPSEHLAIFEEAAKEVADEVTAPRPEGEEAVEDIQVMLSSESNCSNLRELKVGASISNLTLLFVFFVFWSMKTRSIVENGLTEEIWGGLNLFCS